MVIDDGQGLATPGEMERIDAFNEKMQAAGQWVFATGLEGPSAATTIDNRGGADLVSDGPFVETKEYLVGFWLVNVPDFDVALSLAKEGSLACNRKVELRPYHRGGS